MRTGKKLLGADPTRSDQTICLAVSPQMNLSVFPTDRAWGIEPVTMYDIRHCHTDIHLFSNEFLKEPRIVLFLLLIFIYLF